jgi:hypothetical protein
MKLSSEGSSHFVPVFHTFLPALIPPLFIFGMACYGKRKIEDILHYQRLREVCFVLETAYTAFRDSPELLKPPFNDFPNLK